MINFSQFLSLWTFVLYISSLKPSFVEIRQGYVHTNVERSVDLTSPVVRETIALTISNQSSDPNRQYYLPIKLDEKSNLAFIQAYDTSTKSIYNVVKSFRDDSLNVQYYEINFPKMILPDEEFSFSVKLVFTDQFKPLPKFIKQEERQKIDYSSNVYFFSTYETKKQQSKFKLMTSQLDSYSKDIQPFKVSKNAFNYGPFENISPYQYKEMHIHFIYDPAIIHLVELQRDIMLSHLGNFISVEDSYNLHNNGAIMRDQFSRLTYMKQKTLKVPHSGQFTNIAFALPLSATNIYYRDYVGNVSTSSVARKNEFTLMKLRPRYPIMGGWNYSWYQGFQVPLSENLHYDYTSGKYHFYFPFVNTLTNSTTQKAIVRVVLPEGARQIKVHQSFPIDGIQDLLTYSYFDTLGRPTVIFEKFNLIDEHEVPIIISYTYPYHLYLLKPLILSSFLFSFFCISMICSRIDFSLRFSRVKKKTE